MASSRDMYKIVLLPGDGIGVEVMACARDLISRIGDRLDLTLDMKEIACGGEFFLEHGRDWPEHSEQVCREADAILLGAVGWPAKNGSGPVTMADGRMAGYSPVIGNRIALDLYANIRPVKMLRGIRHGISGHFSEVWRPNCVDMVFVRENTEGMYSGMGGIVSTHGVSTLATDVRLITRTASERVIRRAFEICTNREGAPGDGRKRVTCIVKNNVLDGCRLFVEVFRSVGEQFSDIEQESVLIDSFTQSLITSPEHFDVCVTTNMFGDIVTDLASVLQGGMGMAVGCNLGDNHAMFEPIHGSAPPLAGKNVANPIAMLLAVGEMFSWLALRHKDERLAQAAASIEKAVQEQVRAGRQLTQDLVGAEDSASMSEVSEAIIGTAMQILEGRRERAPR